jgi:hypothetical protein
MTGMEDNKLKRLRELSDNINVAIAQATAEVADTKDKAIKANLTDSLTDLQRAWLILDGRLRKK